MRLTSSRLYCVLAFAVSALLALTMQAGATNRGIPLVLGDTVSSAIQPAGDVDTFVFDAFAGEQIAVVLSGSKRASIQPVLEVLDPDGTPMDLTGFTKEKGQKVTLKKLVLPATGVYAIRVSGQGGTEGEYSIKTKGAPVKGVKMKGVPLAAGGELDVPFAATTDTLVVAKIKARDGTFEVLDVYDPGGDSLPGQVGMLKYSKKGASGQLFMNGGLGTYGLTLGNASADLSVDITLKFKHAKHKKRKYSVSPLEPVVDRIDPIYGRPGAKVRIFGENFQEGDVLVLFGDLVGQFPEVESLTEIDAQAPNGEGEVDITVFNPDGQEGTLEDAWTYIAPRPTITSLDPVEGPDDGGTLVDVYGTDFTFLEILTLGGLAPSGGFTIIDEGHLQFTTDAHAAGYVTLVVGDRWEQTASRASAYRYIPKPMLTAVDPLAGTYKGGTVVNLEGANFRGDDRVFLDGGEVTPITIVDDTSIMFITSAHARGQAQIVVRDPWDRDSAAVAFEFNNGNFRDKTSANMPSNDSGSHFGATALALGDVDGDGDRDLVLGTPSSGTGTEPTRILLNNGQGNFKSVGNRVPDQFDADDLGLGDLDGDGDLDLVITQDGIYTKRSSYYYSYTSMPTYYWLYSIPSSSTRVLLNDGNGKFTQSRYAMPDPKKKKGVDILQGIALAIGDLDGDSDLDLVLTHNKNVASSDWSGYLYSWGSGGYYYGSYIKRFYSTYRPDMQSTRVLLNDGKGTFTNASATNMPAVSNGDMFAGDDVALGDVDGDKDLDILLTGDGANLRNSSSAEYVAGSKTRLLKNNGKAVFSDQTASLLPSTSSADDFGGTAIGMGDLDGDTYMDIVFGVNRAVSYASGGTTKYKSSTRVFSGSASGYFTETTGTVMPGVRSDGQGELYKATDLMITDHDGDGDADLFIVDRGAVMIYNPDSGAFDKQVSSTRFLLNSGTGSLTDVTVKSLPNPDKTGDYYLSDALIIGDTDGDSKQDLIISTTLAGYLTEGKYPTRIFLFE